jgi:hypothetical protein
MAQSNVYSLNVVGYVNLSFTSGQLAASSAQLDADGTGTNNTILSQLGTNLAKNTVVYVYNPGNNGGNGGYDTLQFTSLVHNGPLLWTLNGANASTYPLNPGEGFFVLPANTTTVTLVGNVLQGSLTNQYVLAQNKLTSLSSKVPVAGGLSSVLGYVATKNDVVYLYNPADNSGSGGYDTYQFVPLVHNGPAVWTLNGAAAEPTLNIGQSFFLAPAAATPSWVQTFTVQ